MTTRAALYIRVSSDLDEQLDALPGQLHAVQESAARRGYEVVRTFTDPGVSAHTSDMARRPEFQALIEAAKRREFDVILVSDLERWSRNLRLFIDAMETISQLHIPLVSLTFEVDYTSAAGRYTANIMGATAQYQSDALAERVARGKRERARRGEQNNSAPFGYARDASGAIVPNETAAPIVRSIWQRAAAGETTRQIAQATGVAFEQVRCICGNRFYVGEVRYRTTWYPGHHPAICDPALWSLVQAQRTANRRCGSRPRGAHVYSLGGLMTCATCGAHIAGWSRGIYYLCMGRHTHGCRERMLTNRVMVEQVAQLLDSLALDPATLAVRLAAQPQMPAGPDPATLTRKLDRLRDLYTWGDLSALEYQRQRDNLSAQMEGVRRPAHAEAIEEQSLALAALAVAWRGGTPQEQQHMAASFARDFLVREQRIIAVMPQPAWMDTLSLTLPPHDHPGYLAVAS